MVFSEQRIPTPEHLEPELRGEGSGESETENNQSDQQRDSTHPDVLLRMSTEDVLRDTFERPQPSPPRVPTIAEIDANTSIFIETGLPSPIHPSASRTEESQNSSESSTSGQSSSSSSSQKGDAAYIRDQSPAISSPPTHVDASVANEILGQPEGTSIPSVSLVADEFPLEGLQHRDAPRTGVFALAKGTHIVFSSPSSNDVDSAETVRTSEEMSHSVSSQGQDGSPSTLKVNTGVTEGPSEREGNGAPCVGDAPVTHCDYVTNATFKAFVDNITGSVVDLKETVNSNHLSVQKQITEQNSLIASMHTTISAQNSAITELQSLLRTQSNEHATTSRETLQKLHADMEAQLNEIRKVASASPVTEPQISAQEFANLKDELQKLSSSVAASTSNHVTHADLVAFHKKLMDTFTVVNAKFVSKASFAAKSNDQKISSIQANVDLLVADLTERKQRKEDRACKRAELKRKRSEDHDDDSQKGEKEPAQKKTRTDIPEQRQADASASEDPHSTAPETEAPQSQSSQVPLFPTPTPLAQFSGPIPKDPDTAKFLLDMLSKANRTSTSARSVPSATVPEPSKTQSSTPKAAEQSTSVPDTSVPTQSSSPKSSVPEPSVTESETHIPESAPRDPIKEQIERLEKCKIHLTKELNLKFKYALADEKVYLVIPNFANEYNIPGEVKDRFMAHCLLRKEAYSKVPIRRVTGVKHVQFEKTEIMYSIYEVLREDGNTQYFCDNDLLSINPSDLIPLGREMKHRRDEDKHPQDRVAFNRILRCMEAFIVHRRQVDFQVGCDQHVINLSIAAPNESLEGIEQYRSGTLVEKPEEGAIYRRPGGKCFFRLKDAHRYSNTTVEVIKGYASLQMEKGNTEEKALAEKFVKKLDSLLKLRLFSKQLHKIVTLQPDAMY